MTTQTAPTAGSNAPDGQTLVKVNGLKMYFPVTAGLFIQKKIADVRAVDGLDFEVKKGETLGLVGESGCGKSTTGRAVLQLYRPTAGTINFDGTELTELKGTDLRRFRRRMQMIFQDPYSSLNPRMSVGQIIGEPMAIHGLYKGAERTERIQYIMQAVGLNPLFVKRYPHEFSGGQRQRIGIARALAAARDRGYRRAVLETVPAKMAPAVALYRSLGFRPCPPFGRTAASPDIVCIGCDL